MVTSTAAERSNPYKIQLVETSPFHCVSVEVTKLVNKMGHFDRSGEISSA